MILHGAIRYHDTLMSTAKSVVSNIHTISCSWENANDLY